MSRLNRAGMVLALGLGVVPVTRPARAQVFERETTITGPRGRSIDRDVQIRRGPGGVERDITIHRPAGTFRQETFIPRPHGGGGWGPGPRFGRPPIYVGGGGGGGGIGPWGAGLLGGALGAGAGFLAGQALASPPPPPPVVVQQPVIVAPLVPPTVVEYVPPVRYLPAPPPVVVDPVAQEIARFQSYSEGSRRDAAAHLGRMGDARAVMPLVDRLKNDRSHEVRVAAATALGQIGDPGAVVFLERSIVYDKREDVRDASTVALSRVRQSQAQAQLQTAASVAPAGFSSGPVQSSRVPALTPTDEYVPPPPVPQNGQR